MLDAAAYAADPNPLAPDYSAFRVGERLLLTGHSHQAWPDCCRAGQLAAWDDAAAHVDDKWERAFAQADRVRRGWAVLLGEVNPDGDGPTLGIALDRYALGPSTHDLLIKLLSALPLRERPRLLTTDGEFHSLRRQLDRLAEEGQEIAKLPAEPVETLAARLAAAVDGRTAAVFVSSVLFRSARIVPGLGELCRACRRVGAELVVDAYHSMNVVPFTVAGELEEAWVVGGGYKYCQLGEGNAFLRIPPGRDPRPALTGWFAEFDALAARSRGPSVAFGSPASRFAGATYDPVSHYRAARVFDFHAARGLVPALLREVSQRQVGLLRELFDGLDLPPALVDRDRVAPLAELGGFLALRSPRAGALSAALRVRGVWNDFRGEVLRLGPAPYLSDRQLRDAMSLLGEAAGELCERRG